jgi:hypothetical protein
VPKASPTCCLQPHGVGQSHRDGETKINVNIVIGCVVGACGGVAVMCLSSYFYKKRKQRQVWMHEFLQRILCKHIHILVILFLCLYAAFTNQQHLVYLWVLVVAANMNIFESKSLGLNVKFRNCQQAVFWHTFCNITSYILTC